MRLQCDCIDFALACQYFIARIFQVTFSDPNPPLPHPISNMGKQHMPPLPTSSLVNNCLLQDAKNQSKSIIKSLIN